MIKTLKDTLCSQRDQLQELSSSKKGNASSEEDDSSSISVDDSSLE
jgi:hypothetical protein